jgi:hypothetical protein
LSFAGKGEVIEGLDIGLEGSHLNILSLLFSLIKVFFSLLLKYNNRSLHTIGVSAPACI